MKSITIGLTGGIGSGKSTAAKMLAEPGAPAIDADKVGHEIYQPGTPAYRELIEAFGDRILAPDRTIDRRKLGPIVFADPAALKQLNAIVHPKMFTRMGEMVAAMRRGGERRPIVVEAAILIEANWQPLFDEIWLVRAPREQVVTRIEIQRGLKPSESESRIRAQLSDEDRAKHATLVIENNGSIEELRDLLKTVWSEALKRNS